jgi:TonB family protein
VAHNGQQSALQLIRITAFGSLGILILMGCARGEQASESQVKAAYLYNFVKAAEWPAQSWKGDDAPLVIGIFGGDEEFVDVLKAIVAGKTIGTHPISVKHLRMGEDATVCHMVFFRASERKNIPAAVAALRDNNHLLLVGEDPAFLRDGGIINLVLDKGKIQFEVAQIALDRSKIHFTTKFLSLAKGSSGSSNQHADGSRVVLIKTSPEYPAIARQMNLKGSVQIEALVGRDGMVKDVKVLGGHPLLADAMSRAVKQWKYEPGPKESIEIVKYSFEPPSTP